MTNPTIPGKTSPHAAMSPTAHAPSGRPVHAPARNGKSRSSPSCERSSSSSCARSSRSRAWPCSRSPPSWSSTSPEPEHGQRPGGGRHPVGNPPVRGDARASTACSSRTPTKAASTVSCWPRSTARPLLFAKALSLLAYLFVLELVAVPAFALLCWAPLWARPCPPRWRRSRSATSAWRRSAP